VRDAARDSGEGEGSAVGGADVGGAAGREGAGGSDAAAFRDAVDADPTQHGGVRDAGARSSG
jgi:hypothetical protein